MSEQHIKQGQIRFKPFGHFNERQVGKNSDKTYELRPTDTCGSGSGSYGPKWGITTQTGSGSGGYGPVWKIAGLGYHPDLPDFRDKGHDEFKETIKKFIELQPDGKKEKAFSILNGQSKQEKRLHLGDKTKMPSVEDQGNFNSCTANAVISLAEYLILNSQEPEELDLSRFFLYKTTRRMLGWSGDVGAYIRTTMKAMVMFGSPPEHDWPYSSEYLDREPEAYIYALAQNFKAATYSRLDNYGSRGADTLDIVKRTIACGFPVAFGFPVYKSIESMGGDFVIPFPTGRFDKLIGGHAVVAAGYDDNVPCGNNAGKGALIIRNSWGEEWGDMGYGYLPYDYVIDELAVDFWTIFQQNWVNPAWFE